MLCWSITVKWWPTAAAVINPFESILHCVEHFVQKITIPYFISRNPYYIMAPLPWFSIILLLGKPHRTTDSPDIVTNLRSQQQCFFKLIHSFVWEIECPPIVKMIVLTRYRLLTYAAVYFMLSCSHGYINRVNACNDSLTTFHDCPRCSVHRSHSSSHWRFIFFIASIGKNALNWLNKKEKKW